MAGRKGRNNLGFNFNGAKLKDLRKQRGLTQTALAELLNSDGTGFNVKASTISKWENGDANPSFQIMRELSYRFGIKDDNYWKSDGTVDSKKKKEEKVKVKTEKPAATIFTIKKNVENLEDLVVTIDDRINDLETKVRIYEEQVKELDMIVRQYKDIYVEKMDKISANYKNLEGRINNLAEDTFGLDNRMDGIESMCSSDGDELNLKLLVNALAKVVVNMEG